MYSTLSMLGLGITGLLLILALFFPRRSRATARETPWPWRIVHGAFVISVFILAATAYASVWRDVSMRGWFLLVHLLAAGACLVLLPIVVLAGLRERGTLRAAGFLLAVSGFVTAVPVLLSMQPLLGTEELEDALEVHRYGGLTLAIVVLGQLCLRRWRVAPAPDS